MHRKWHSRRPSPPNAFPTETETHYELHEGAQVVQVGGLNFPPSPLLLPSRWFRVFGTTKRQIREKLKEKGYDATLQHERKIAILLYFNNALRYVIPTRNCAGAGAGARAYASPPSPTHPPSGHTCCRCALPLGMPLPSGDSRRALLDGGDSRLPSPCDGACKPKWNLTHSESYFVYIWFSHKFIPFPGMHWAYLLERIVCPNLFRFVYRAGNEGTT